MNKYAYVVASNAKYVPGLNALLNSLDYVGNTHDVIMLDYGLPSKWWDAILAAEFSFNINRVLIKQEEIDFLGEAEVLMRKRYLIPSQYPEYDSFCILDADMFFAHNPEVYLEIAAKTGLVLGNLLEQKRRYGDKNHEVPFGSGNYLVDPNFWNAHDLACAPLFVGREWYPALKKSWDLVDQPFETRFKGPDMDALNICLLEAGSFDRTVPLSQHNWTGLHESFMKAHTRAVDIHGKMCTEDGEPIYCAHGQFWNKTWRGWQIDGQMGMIEREFDNSISYRSRSLASFEHVLNCWKKIGIQHKVNINDFMAEIPSRGPASEVMEIT